MKQTSTNTNKRETAERRRKLLDAVRRVMQRHNPETLGPCVICEWPITNMFTNRVPPPGTVCDLCDRFTDTPFCRDFWNDYPANVI